MNKILANLSLRQRLVIGMVAVLAAGSLYSFVHWQKEGDFRPLFTGIAPEDAAGIVQKLKEAGVEYRLPEGGGSVLVPSARVAELRLAMAAAGLPKTGRIGFELFDKMNLGATEFTERVNYRRALEGELERSVMVLTEVEQARVHITFPKDSVFVESQQSAKASVVIVIRPGSRISPQNIQAINHLVASAVEGLSPDSVSVLDSNGNLLGRPKSAGTLDGQEGSDAVLEFRRKVETDLQAKINSTLEPLLGADKFRTGVSVECDFSGGEQSEEIFDPARSVMLSSQRTEDSTGAAVSSGVPGTASTLPRPTSKPASSGSGKVSRINESITYQSSRTVKKTRTPAGTVKKMSLAILVDQELKWQKDKSGYQRILVPPAPEKLKIIHDLVAGITGFSAERGDQLIVETLPFENTLTLEPPDAGGRSPAKPIAPPGMMFTWTRNTMLAVGGGAVVLILLGFAAVKLRKRGAATVKTALPGAPSSTHALPGPAIDDQMESKLAERDALQHRMESQALGALKLTPVITKTAEVLAKHLREKIKHEPETSAQVLRAWIHEEER